MSNHDKVDFLILFLGLEDEIFSPLPLVQSYWGVNGPYGSNGFTGVSNTFFLRASNTVGTDSFVENFSVRPVPIRVPSLVVMFLRRWYLFPIW